MKKINAILENNNSDISEKDYQEIAEELVNQFKEKYPYTFQKLGE